MVLPTCQKLGAHAVLNAKPSKNLNLKLDLNFYHQHDLGNSSVL